MKSKDGLHGWTYGIGEEPVNEAGVEDGASCARNFGVCADELDRHSSVAEVGGQGEVGDGRDECDGDDNVVEDAVAARCQVAPDDEDDGREHHDRRDGPQPVGAICGDVNLGARGVAYQNIVRSLVQERRHFDDGFRGVFR